MPVHSVMSWNGRGSHVTRVQQRQITQNAAMHFKRGRPWLIEWYRLSDDQRQAAVFRGIRDRDPGAVVEATCLESQKLRVRTYTAGYNVLCVVQTLLWHLGFQETKCFFPAHSLRFSIVGSLCDWEVACSASDHLGSNFESCVWRVVSSHSGSPDPI